MNRLLSGRGAAAGGITRHGWFTPEVRAMLIVGVMGGLTTFSAFDRRRWHCCAAGMWRWRRVHDRERSHRRAAGRVRLMGGGAGDAGFSTNPSSPRKRGSMDVQPIENQSP